MMQLDETATEATGPFTVRWMGGSWFIGTEQASQRIEDGAWLDTWLAANGEGSRLAVEFDGDLDLRERFIQAFGPVESNQPKAGFDVAGAPAVVGSLADLEG